jgi:hypothetical protein
MRPYTRLSASMAAVLAITSIDIATFAAAAHAAKNHNAPSRSYTKPSTQRFSPKVYKVQPRIIQRQGVTKQPLVKQPVVLKPNFKVVPFVAKKHAVAPVAQQILVRKNLPMFKPTPNIGALKLKPRLALPVNAQPKLTLVKAPKPMLAPKFAPFVQRHWKKAFFWVAVAGIGYVTIPEFYYNRWAAYVDDDDYDSALGLLSLAALDDDDDIVRTPKPADVAYRYQATVAPAKIAASTDTTEPAGASTAEVGASCTLQPFVDRQWGQPYSWVQIPEVGNVTVPDQAYDRFISFVASEPPNYGTACTVLAEVAAADTVSPAEATSTN